MRVLLAAGLLLATLTALVPMASADPIEFYPGSETPIVNTCVLDPGLGVGYTVYYQPIYYGTYEPLPHADGVILTAGAHEHGC